MEVHSHSQMQLHIAYISWLQTACQTMGFRQKVYIILVNVNIPKIVETNVRVWPDSKNLCAVTCRGCSGGCAFSGGYLLYSLSPCEDNKVIGAK